MMGRYGVFDQQGGITHVVFCPATMAGLQSTDALSVIELEEHQDDSNSYVDVGSSAVKAKQPFGFSSNKTQIKADGVDEVVVSEVPAGTTILWPDGQEDEVTDGEARFSVDLPGLYTLTFDAVPYLREEVTIEAVSAA